MDIWGGFCFRNLPCYYPYVYVEQIPDVKLLGPEDILVVLDGAKMPPKELCHLCSSTVSW